MTIEGQEEKAWSHTKEMLGSHELHFGQHWAFNFRQDPKRLGFVLSRYKFAAKICSKNRRILELGCSDAIGATILAERAINYTGVDLDASAIETARFNLPSDRFQFIYDDFMGKKYGEFGAVASLDVVEHILPEFADEYFETVARNLSRDGICVIGTPNITAAPYASIASQIGHVNLYSQDKLVEALRKHFHQVLPFGMNDEMLHTGYAPMCHYLLCVACLKK